MPGQKPAKLNWSWTVSECDTYETYVCVFETKVNIGKFKFNSAIVVAISFVVDAHIDFVPKKKS